MSSKIRHVLGLSGGKDSAALAIYMRDKVPEMEYFFTDTGEELTEVYEYIARLEDFLGKKIHRLEPEKNFSHYLYMHQMLPSRKIRWCTVSMKIQPFERFIGGDNAISYIGIRADEDDRKGYLSTKKNITPVFPFIEAGIDKPEVFRILKDSGVGIPEYYNWRSRSGCTFCFYQRKDEWLGLAKFHPDKFKEADKYEQDIITHVNKHGGNYFTWHERGTLRQLLIQELEKQMGYITTSHESIDELIQRASDLKTVLQPIPEKLQKISLLDRLASQEDDDPEDQACLICSL